MHCFTPEFGVEQCARANPWSTDPKRPIFGHQGRWFWCQSTRLI